MQSFRVDNADDVLSFGAVHEQHVPAVGRNRRGREASERRSDGRRLATGERQSKQAAGFLFDEHDEGVAGCKVAATIPDSGTDAEGVRQIAMRRNTVLRDENAATGTFLTPDKRAAVRGPLDIGNTDAGRHGSGSDRRIPKSKLPHASSALHAWPPKYFELSGTEAG